jgi:hypothetical protein
MEQGWNQKNVCSFTKFKWSPMMFTSEFLYRSLESGQFNQLWLRYLFMQNHIIFFMCSHVKTPRGFLWYLTSAGKDLGEGLIWACSPWLVRRVLEPCVAAKNKLVSQSGQYLASGVGWGVTFGIRARLTGCPMVPTGSLGSLKGVDCNIPRRRVRTWGRALY